MDVSGVTPKFETQNPLARSMVMWIAKSISATNQNRGATIRINVMATTRCIRQCTSNGSAQPFF